MKLSYALTAAATRGSAGAELVVGGDDDAGSVDVELPEVPGADGVVLWLSGALGPGFGALLPHPVTTAAATAAAVNATQGDLRTFPPFGGDVRRLVGVTPAVT